MMKRRDGWSLDKLAVWRKAMALTEEVYELADDLPETERFGLSTQLKRTAVSIPSNIAEGSGAGSDAMFLKHVRIARGSVAELETQLRLVRRLELASDGIPSSLWELFEDVGRLATGLERRLSRDVD